MVNTCSMCKFPLEKPRVSTAKPAVCQRCQKYKAKLRHELKKFGEDLLKK